MIMTEKKSSVQMQADQWAGERGEKWNEHLDQFEGGIAEIGSALIAAAELTEGERVIDVGCGAGATSLEIARIVGDQGRVTCLDISPVLLETAKGRARARAIENIDFLIGDATQADIPNADFDCLFSRFGIMFFDEPFAAFAHMHTLLNPRGRLNFACWGPLPENPWVTQPMSIVRQYVETPPPEPRAPGPFAFDDPEYVTDILTRAGFIDVSFTPWHGEQLVGGPGSTPSSAAEFMMNALFVGEALAEQPQQIKDRALNELATLMADFQSADGIRMPATAWLVSAKV
jgi:SAM-dependent methyltransferase